MGRTLPQQTAPPFPHKTHPPPTQAMARQQHHDPAAYEAFRSAPLPSAATALAATGNVAALAVLLQRHPAALGPHLLRVLSALPETLDPRTYSSLLPRADSGAPSGVSIPGPSSALAPAAAAAVPGGPPPQPTGSGGRCTDWVELPEAWRELAAVSGGVGAGVGRAGSSGLQPAGSTDVALQEEAASLLHATEDLERASLAAGAAAAAAAAGAPPPPNGGSLWPAAAGVGAWYAQRAVEIDAAAGQLPHALALVDLALQRGAQPDTSITVGGGSSSSSSVTLGQLQVLGRVLASAMRAWFPGNVVSSSGAGTASNVNALDSAAAATSSSHSATGWLRSRLRGVAAGASSAPDSTSAAEGWNNAAAAGAGAGAAGGRGDASSCGPPVWLVSLEALSALPLTQQLEAVLAGRNVEALEAEVTER